MPVPFGFFSLNRPVVIFHTNLLIKNLFGMEYWNIIDTIGYIFMIREEVKK